MRKLGMGALLVAAVGCTSVHMVQRDGCWVKKTETTLGNSSEELGFCAKPEPQPAEDRMARLVQECMAQADYRWQNRAIAAWGRNEPIPPQDADDAIAKTCMTQASAALGLEAENGVLRSRLAELSSDRESLKETAEKDREYLYQSSDKLVTALGEAANKTMPNVTATATSTTKSDSNTPPQTPTMVMAPAPVVVNGAPAPVVVNGAVMPRRTPAAACLAKRAHPAAKSVECETPPAPPPEAQPDTASAAPVPKAG
jgi:hypothetical protein